MEERSALTTDSVAQAERLSWRERLSDPEFWINWTAVIALAILVIVFGVASPAFLSLGNIRAVLIAAALLVILTVGQTLVILTGGIDLSLAATMTWAGVVLGQVVAHGGNIGLASLLAIVAGLLVGLINGLLIAWGRIPDFIATLGTLSAASGAALIFSSGEPVTIVSTFLLQLATGSLGPVPYFVLIALIVVLLGHVLLFYTRFGTHLLATGGDAEAARAMGIRTARIKLTAYVLAGGLAGLAAILFTARIGAAEPAVDTSYLLNSVAAVVLGGVSLFGGRGSIAGPAAGALLLTVLVNGLTLLGVSQFYQPVVVGLAVVLAALLVRYWR
ncbi:MAG: ABC transporter permease [Thermogemmatispora sp.]|uniref:ABC transporter permease n=1 Tax=Thermogemmatispora sp. TaxID=1968838 RepID=UPI002633E1CE|nr:ABC transporter permease [Thermogemmatispora sp.]MBX5458663.1 ABC transporter permease [Thermogemmatispora sp.]